MKHLNFIKSILAPTLILGLVLKAIVLGVGFPESLIIGFLTALYGVEVFFYLKRLHRVENRKLIKIEKEVTELRSHISALKLQTTRAPMQNVPVGNVAWQNNLKP